MTPTNAKTLRNVLVSLQLLDGQLYLPKTVLHRWYLFLLQFICSILVIDPFFRSTGLAATVRGVLHLMDTYSSPAAVQGPFGG